MVAVSDSYTCGFEIHFWQHFGFSLSVASYSVVEGSIRYSSKFIKVGLCVLEMKVTSSCSRMSFGVDGAHVPISPDQLTAELRVWTQDSPLST